MARAIATTCRWPPESVPTGCSRSATLMPMRRSSASVRIHIVATSRRRNGQVPRMISDPRKKLRQIDKQRHQRQRLVDRGDAEIERLARRAEVHRLAVDGVGALVVADAARR